MFIYFSSSKNSLNPFSSGYKQKIDTCHNKLNYK